MTTVPVVSIAYTSLFLVCGLLTQPAHTQSIVAADKSGGDDRVVVDNERVTVLDISGPREQPSRLARDLDAVVIQLENATLGEAVFKKKGLPLANKGRAILVELKDHKAAPFANTSGYPNAFPRAGAKKLIGNDRVTVWAYTWTPGVPTPMHFHNTDVVVVYLGDGALTSTTPDGVSTVSEYSFGFTKFNPGNRIHTETLTRGRVRAVMVELK